MTRKFTLLLVALFAGASFLSAQADSARPPCLQLYNVQANAGFLFFRSPYLMIDEMRKIAPGSTMLSGDFSSFGERTYSSISAPRKSLNVYAGDVHPLFSAHVEFVPYSKKRKAYKRHTSYRAGLQYNRLQVNSVTLERSTSYRSDTIDNGGGQFFYLDTTQTERYDFTWRAKSITLDFSQVFHTDDGKHFSAWFGYGVQLGVCYGARFDGYYNSTKTTTLTPVDFASPPIPAYTYYDLHHEHEQLALAPTFIARAYLPIGFQFRLSTKPNIFSRFAVTSETRPGIDLQQLPGLGIQPRFNIATSAGLRYYFHSRE